MNQNHLILPDLWSKTIHFRPNATILGNWASSNSANHPKCIFLAKKCGIQVKTEYFHTFSKVYAISVKV